jgi:hypothetical protein
VPHIGPCFFVRSRYLLEAARDPNKIPCRTVQQPIVRKQFLAALVQRPIVRKQSLAALVRQSIVRKQYLVALVRQSIVQKQSKKLHKIIKSMILGCSACSRYLACSAGHVEPQIKAISNLPALSKKISVMD